MRLIAYPSAQKAIQKTTISNLQLIGSQKISQVSDWLNRLKSDAERIGINPSVLRAVTLGKTDTSAISQLFPHLSREVWFRRYMICDASGNIRASSDDRMIGLNIANVEGFSQAVEGGTSVSDIVSSVFYDSDEFGNRADRLPVMYISVPVRNEEG